MLVALTIYLIMSVRQFVLLVVQVQVKQQQLMLTIQAHALQIFQQIGQQRQIQHHHILLEH